MGQSSEDQKKTEPETVTYGGYTVKERTGMLGGWRLRMHDGFCIHFDCLGEFYNWVELSREVLWKEVCRIENSRSSSGRK